MEGFLLKKGRGESKMFGRRNWKKRWCVLEGQYFTYYEDFDREKNIPINKKGVAPVRGCEISIVPHQEKKFCFVVKHESRQPLFLCAEKEKLMHVWMKALESAAKGITGPNTFNFDEYYDILSLDKSEELTVSSLNKAYRKAALKNHPDKGGNVDAFKKIQEAFEILQSKLEEDEQSKLYKEIRFTAEIVKGPPGVGFGMVVVEDTKKGAIIAKDILPVMILRSISDESGGSLQKGDRIIGIDNDDITSWTLARVVQRLNDFRAPVDTTVNFTFSRKVKLEDDELKQQEQQEDNENQYQSEQNEDNKNYSDQDRRRGQSQESSNNDFNKYRNSQEGHKRNDGNGDYDDNDDDIDMEARNTFRNSGFSNPRNDDNIDIDDDNDNDNEEIPTFHYEKRTSAFTTDYASADIDEDDFVPPPVPPSNPQPQYTSEKPKKSVFSSDYASADIDEDDFVPPPVPPSNSQPKNSNRSDFASMPKEPQSQSQQSQPQKSSSRPTWEIDPMVQLVSLKAENEDLQTEVDRLNQLIASLTKERDHFQQEAQEYKMRYEDAESERLEFLKQLSEVESECEQLERRERDALKLLEKLSEQGQLSSQQSAEIQNNIQMAARATQSGELLSDVGQSYNWGSIEHAQQAAIKAVSYVDSTGQFQEKFTQHEIGKNFLKKLEDSVLRQYGNSSAYNATETDDEGDNRDHYTSYDQNTNYNNSQPQHSYHNHSHHSNGPEEYSPYGNHSLLNNNNIKSQSHRTNFNSLPHSYDDNNNNVGNNKNISNINNKQRSGTQLYQSHKSNLRPVNRPSMEKTRANTLYTQSPPNGNNKNSQMSSNIHHSPIKTSSNEYYDNNIDDRKSSIRQPRSSGHQMESRLYQQTASSTNRISRNSDVNRNTNISDTSGNNIQQSTTRNRSPRRSDNRGNRTSKNAIYD